MYIPRSLHTTIVLETLLEHFRSGKNYFMDETDLPPEFLEPKGCFVSYYLPNQVMRGCIGSIEPTKKNLYKEIEKNAILAAFEDARFPPLLERELSQVSILVEVVKKPERIYNPGELDPEKFGVIVKNENNQTGVLLPRCQGVETVEQQVTLAMQKGGIDVKSWDPAKFRLYRFSVEQFH
jgi:AmmeMemoRadiSam system protein A